jgi:hypothetical protein
VFKSGMEGGGGVKSLGGALSVRNGSGLAERWTSVSPCVRCYTVAEDGYGERYCRICVEPICDADLDSGDTGAGRCRLTL